MKARDEEYIINRLNAGTVATEAVGRLRQVGYDEQANALMEAIQEFNDRCREINRAVQERNRAAARIANL